MRTPAHPWAQAARQTGRRFFYGMLTALSLTLVAFEWTTHRTQETVVLHDPWEGEEPDYPKVVVIEKSSTAAPERKKRSSSRVDLTSEPTSTETSETPEGSNTEGGTGTTETNTAAGELMGTETVENHVFGYGEVGVRPYFMDCLTRRNKSRDECTEDRIAAHLQRQFKMPEGVRGQVRTTVTFEIDREGRIGRLVCTPRVAAPIEAEIERVIRAMPQFVPGSQNGHPVAVYYRIPLSLRNL